MSGCACSCVSPHVEATRPDSKLVVDSVLRKMVQPRMHQAAVVPRKITAIASMRLIIGMWLEEKCRRPEKARPGGFSCHGLFFVKDTRTLRFVPHPCMMC